MEYKLIFTEKAKEDIELFKKSGIPPILGYYATNKSLIVIELDKIALLY